MFIIIIIIIMIIVLYGLVRSARRFLPLKYRRRGDLNALAGDNRILGPTATPFCARTHCAGPRLVDRTLRPFFRSGFFCSPSRNLRAVSRARGPTPLSYPSYRTARPAHRHRRRRVTIRGKLTIVVRMIILIFFFFERSFQQIQVQHDKYYWFPLRQRQ